MQIRVSAKGRVVLPNAVRRKLHLRKGDSLDVKVETGRIVLAPRQTRRKKISTVVDPIAGLTVLSAGPDALPLTTEQVHEILARFHEEP